MTWSDEFVYNNGGFDFINRLIVCFKRMKFPLTGFIFNQSWTSYIVTKLNMVTT